MLNPIFLSAFKGDWRRIQLTLKVKPRYCYTSQSKPRITEGEVTEPKVKAESGQRSKLMYGKHYPAGTISATMPQSDFTAYCWFTVPVRRRWNRETKSDCLEKPLISQQTANLQYRFNDSETMKPLLISQSHPWFHNKILIDKQIELLWNHETTIWIDLHITV